MKSNYKRIEKLINKYELGYDIDYSIDELKQMINEHYDDNKISGEEYDNLLEMMEELEEY